jgi:Mannosyl-glycoprotein endo-beta-N-acetylglucosaminidase
MTKLKFLLVPLMVLGTQLLLMASPNPSHYTNYVDNNLKFAILYAKSKKIPVSICLAQAMHESAAGQSTLATKANNHFGIKAADTLKWTGERYFIEDDDYDKSGKLRKSAFRKYNSVESSFKDYADFLSKNKRYQHLFNIPIEDYRSWANGLAAAGYATDPEYATYLIEKIEKYKLYRYDLPADALKEKQPEKLLVKINEKPTKQVSSSANLLGGKTQEKKVKEKPTYNLITKPSNFTSKSQIIAKVQAQKPTTKVNVSSSTSGKKVKSSNAPNCPEPAQKIEPMDAKPVFSPIKLRE